MPRRLVPLLALVLAFGAGAETAAAHTLSKRAALKKTGSVARKAAIADSGAYWFAGACKRRTAHKVACWGGVAYADGSGCIQKVVVSYRSHASRRIRARRTGSILCGDLPSDAQSGTGGGGGSPVVCAIRQSVCI